jgi:hypothetical protein
VADAQYAVNFNRSILGVRVNHCSRRHSDEISDTSDKLVDFSDSEWYNLKKFGCKTIFNL